MEHEPQPAVCQDTEVKLDGFFLISSSWNVWKPSKSPNILFPLKVRKSRVSTFARGSRYLESYQELYVLRMFEVCDHVLNIAFYTPEDEVLSYNLILTIVKTALENASQRLKDSETTQRLRQQLFNFNNSKKTCLFNICLNEYFAFGDVFSEELRSLVQSHADVAEFDFAFLSASTGQSCQLQYFEDHFNINHEFVIEFVCHIALDCKVFGKYLLWSREGLTKLFGSPSHEYYPNAIKDFGNYYFQYDNVTLHEKEFAVVEIKFYTWSHKFCHNNSHPPFCIPGASRLFLEAATKKLRKSSTVETRRLQNRIDNVRHELQILYKILEDFNQLPTGSARFEAICSFNTFQLPSVCLDSLLRVIRITDVISEQNLYQIDASCLKYRCESIFNPYATLVENYLHRLEQLEETNFSFFNIEVGQILSCEAGEAIISFLLYGISVCTRYRRGYDYNLCKDLGLVNFNKYSETRFPLLGNGALSLRDNMLNYEARFNYINLLCPNEYVCGIDFFDLYQFLRNVSVNTYEQLCKYLIHVICKCINLQFMRNSQGFDTIKSTSFLIKKFQRHRILSSFTFSRLFFEMDNQYFEGLESLIFLRGLVFSCLEEKEINFLSRMMMNTLDKEMIGEKCNLFYPIPRFGVWIVTPISSSNPDSTKTVLSIWNVAIGLVDNNCNGSSQSRNNEILLLLINDYQLADTVANLDLQKLLQMASTFTCDLDINNGNNLIDQCFVELFEFE